MAQASSAQREPSMEEILASIRRIIEDGDGGRKPGEAAVSAPEIEQAPPASGAEVETFRAELGAVAAPTVERRGQSSAVQPAAAPDRSEPAQVTEFAKPLRLAEVQAQVSRESAAPAKSPEPERKPVTLAEVQAQMARDAAGPAAAPVTAPAIEAGPQAAPVRPVAETVVERPTPEFTVERPAQLSAQGPKREEIAQKPVIVAPAPPAQAWAAAAPETTELEAAARQIISPVASRQVAAAFGELSEAFAARSKRTFDEMAEQMLRPMLQEWLDNNLPLLVERLVREEIERVARGA